MTGKRPHRFSLLLHSIKFDAVQRHTLSLIALAALARPTAHGQNTPVKNAAAEFFEEPDWQAVCSRALESPLPPSAETLAGSATANPAPQPGQCDEQSLYYGFGRRPNYQQAIHCAYGHRAHPETPANSALEGAGTLAMIYANGDGVPRNYSFAIRFACEVGTKGGSNAPERIGRLEALRDGKLPPGARFDLCDEQMSGAMGAYCSDLSEKQADVGRARRIAAIKARLPGQAQAMLAALQAAETAFEQARIKGEYTGGGGSGAAGFAIGDQDRLREQFVINLERFNTGELPKASAAQRQLAQQELDKAYAAAIGLQATEAAWQELFRQWMQFVPVAYPGLSRDEVATELLRLRIHQVKRAS